MANKRLEAKIEEHMKEIKKALSGEKKDKKKAKRHANEILRITGQRIDDDE